MAESSVIYRPEPICAQPGPQTVFLSTSADIALLGGEAGGGKTFSVILEPTRHIENPNFFAVTFRRTYPQIMNEGGPWDDSFKVYPQLGGEPFVGDAEWRFPSGATHRFSHMQHEKDRIAWDGSQVPLIQFDQVEHFTRGQVFYMFSRNRTTCGVQPYMRWTANPPANPRRHWLRKFVDWWIGPDGFVIPERSGVIRYFTVKQDREVWGDTPDEVRDLCGDWDCNPKSFTFVHASLSDNPKMTEKDPGYRDNLEILPEIEKKRLKGNWNVEASAGSYYRREWFRYAPAVPAGSKWIRYWDRAATEWDENNPPPDRDQPSKTAGVKMAMDRDDRIYICGLRLGFWSAGTVKTEIRRTAEADGPKVEVGIERDPGSAGKTEAEDQAKNLHGYPVWVNTVRESKDSRARPFSSQVQAGNVYIVGRPGEAWVEEYIDEMEVFDGLPGGLNDVGDASSGAYMRFATRKYVSAPLR